MADIVVPAGDTTVTTTPWEPYIEVSGTIQLQFVLYLRRDGVRAASITGPLPGWRLIAVDSG